MDGENPFARLFQQRPPAKPVRLAVLAAGNLQDPLEVSIIHADPRDTQYTCISYDRSKDFGSVNVDVDGAPFAVPKPLETAMRALRESQRPRTLWADLLIGSTPEERSTQAREMKTVFENANYVTAWLGAGSVQHNIALDMLRLLAERWEQAKSLTNFPDNSNHATAKQMQDAHQYIGSTAPFLLQPSNTELWTTVKDIFSNSYFQTTKSITEIVLAKTVRMTFGQKSVSWKEFTSATMGFLNVTPVVGWPADPDFSEAFQRIARLEQATTRKRKGESLELFPMIKDARRTSYGDPREIVFSMLPIITPSKRTENAASRRPSPPEANYARDLKSVLTDASKYIIEDRQDVMLWWDERPPCSRGVLGLPSWATDFSTPIMKDRTPTVFISPNNGLREWADPLDHKRVFVDDTNGLHVQAYALDRVSYVSRIFTLENCRRLCLEQWLMLPSVSNENPVDKLARVWRALVLNTGGVSEVISELRQPPEEISVSFQSLLVEEQILEMLGCTMEELASQPPELIARARERPDIQALNGLPGYSQQFEHLLRRTAIGRRFIQTESGRCGMTSVELLPFEEAADGAATPTPNFDNILSDPLGSMMIGGFESYLANRDPRMAEILSKAIDGTIVPGQRPPGVRVGDLVVAIIGGFQPYFVRPVKSQGGQENASGAERSTVNAMETGVNFEDEAKPNPIHLDANARYNFVGDGYVHGVMEGECFKETMTNGEQRFKQDVPTIDIIIV